MGVNIAIFSRIFGIFRPKKKPAIKRKTAPTPITPIPFDNLSKDERVWDIHHNSGTIVSPLTNEVISHKVETKIVVDRREPTDERRLTPDRRVGEADRRKKKKFRLFNRRKNPWNRRSGQERRFGSDRRSGTGEDVMILDKDTEHVTLSYPNNLNKPSKKSTKQIINSSTLDDLQDKPSHQRYEIRPQKMSIGEGKNSNAIISSRIDVDNVDERITFGQSQSFKEGENNINSLGNKTPVILDDGKKIANIYVNESAHYVEIFEGPFDTIGIQFSEDKSELEFHTGDKAVGITGTLAEHDLNLIANNNITINLNDDHACKIKIGSYKTFGF